MRKRPSSRRLIEPMGTRNFLTSNSHFNFANKDPVTKFVNGNMYRAVGSFWVLLFSYVCFLFGSISRFFFRVQECKTNSNVVCQEQDDDPIGSSSCSQNPEMDETIGERENSVVFTETTLSMSTNKYEFSLSDKGFSGFVEEPRAFSFTIHEFFSDKLETDCFEEEQSGKAADYSKSFVIDKFSEAKEEIPLSEETEENVRNDQQLRAEIPMLIDLENAEYKEVKDRISPEENSADSDEEYIELKLQNQIWTFFDEEASSGEVLADIKDETGQQDSSHEKGEQEIDVSVQAEEPSLQKNKGISDSDVQDDDPNLFELEDDDIVLQQLKMELRNARTGGLPTILEEEESEYEELMTPKILQELKPIKIDEKIEHKDAMEEIQRVYKRYLDKMKKLDILNFQTMHALGLLQLKDAIQSNTARKSSVRAKRSLSFHKLWSWKQGTAIIDPTKKIIADLHREFEMVYVGQICLSWEILHWQYRKVQELHVYDSQQVVHHQYNQVAAEFQLSQVFLQRFIEDEPFQGLIRVQNYVKNRCILRNLLQVPVIRDDDVKNKGNKEEHEEEITSQMLAEIIEESMRVFWEFIRADKDENCAFKLGHLQLRDHVNLELLMNVETRLQKKHKKLKDMMRCGNCIVKKFQKQRRDRMHHSLFIAQVELKLVSRVLNMSRLTTDQLIWCHEKLEKIRFCNRKVFVEPSFLLFPC